MLILEEIIKICDTLAGIKSVQITDPANINAEGNIIDPFSSTPIPIRQYSGKYTEQPGRSDAGDYQESTFTFEVPKRRLAIERAKQLCANRHVAVVFINASGESITLPWCRVKIAYDSGTKLGQTEGYTITITQVVALTGYDTIRRFDIVVPVGPHGLTIQGTGGGSAVDAPTTPPPEDVCQDFTIELEVTDYTINVFPNNEPATGTLVITFIQDGITVQTGSGLSYTTTTPGAFTVLASKGTCTKSASTVIQSGCELIQILPFLTNYHIHANIINAPDGHTIEVLDEANTVLATSLPFEATLTGAYYIKVINGTKCSRLAGIYVQISACSFVVNIDDKEADTLTFTTDAAPGYEWEWLYTDDSNVAEVISTAETIKPGKSGLYTIRVFDLTCSTTDTAVKVIEPRPRNFEAHYDFTGSTLLLHNINLAKIINPETDLIVRIGSTVATHADTPSAEFQYATNATTNQLLFWAPLSPTNENIYINEV